MVNSHGNSTRNCICRYQQVIMSSRGASFKPGIPRSSFLDFADCRQSRRAWDVPEHTNREPCVNSSRAALLPIPTQSLAADEALQPQRQRHCQRASPAGQHGSLWLEGRAAHLLLPAPGQAKQVPPAVPHLSAGQPPLRHVRAGEVRPITLKLQSYRLCFTHGSIMRATGVQGDMRWEKRNVQQPLRFRTCASLA